MRGSIICLLRRNHGPTLQFRMPQHGPPKLEPNDNIMGFPTRSPKSATSYFRCSSNNVVLARTTDIDRMGPEDGMVTVKVGGQEFHTLKSTLQVSPVIWQAFLESNRNDQSPFFLDRDPKHFPAILAYLRNKADGISYNQSCHPLKQGPKQNYSQRDDPSSSTNSGNFFRDKYVKYIRLPASLDDLEDLYIEATYYQLEDLKVQVSHRSAIVSAMNFVNGGSSNGRNPFEIAKENLKTARNFAVVGLGTGGMALLTDTKDSIAEIILPLLS